MSRICGYSSSSLDIGHHLWIWLIVRRYGPSSPDMGRICGYEPSSADMADAALRPRGSAPLPPRPVLWHPTVAFLPPRVFLAPGRRLPSHAKHVGNGPLIPIRIVGPETCFVASAEIQVDAGGVDGEAGFGPAFDVHGLSHVQG